MDFWQELVKLLGGAGILIGAAAWLVKSLITARLNRDIHEYTSQLRISTDSAIEKIKAELSESLQLSIDQVSRRRDVYVKVIKSMRAFQLEANEEAKKAFVGDYQEACLWASSDVADAINAFIKLVKKGEDNQEKLQDGYSACIKAMRKECGNESENFEYQIFKFPKT